MMAVLVRNVGASHTAALALVLGTASPCLAQNDAPKSEASSEPAGILPVPPYAGDVWTRPYLSGDWGGTRTDLANKGIQLNIDWTQIVQSVVNGGVSRNTEYGGTLDYNITLDLMRMGVMPGALVKFRAESRYGQSVNIDSGSILPVNTDALFPLTRSLDDEVPFTITNLSYIQFLSPKFAVILGKLDTLDGDPNEFASGRGTSQFMDANFIFNSSMGLRLPYSTLGVGMIWMPTPPGPRGGITVTSSLIATSDSSTTSGFKTLDDGLSWSTEADFQYRLGHSNLPGGMNVGFLASFDQDFTKIGSRLVFVPGQGLTVPSENDTWAAYWSMWQYLFVRDPSDAPIDTANGIADHQGIGVFARAGVADKNTNPVEWSLSAGIGGRGVFDRTNDTYGAGYYYTDVQSTRFLNAAGIASHTQGFEAFYNLAITPAAQLTFDLQVIESALATTDTATILGMRLRLVF